MDSTMLSRCTGARIDRARAALPGLLSAMDHYEITNTRERIAMFLANVGHETMRLERMREIWGPTPAQRRYEGRTDLGNVQPGDGKRFMGRGCFHTTGRANYARLRDRLRARGVECPDFEAEPASLELPEWAPLSAADYVDMRNLSQWADQGNFLRYCIGVNGRNAQGLPNGWEDRKKLHAAALEVLT